MDFLRRSQQKKREMLSALLGRTSKPTTCCLVSMILCVGLLFFGSFGSWWDVGNIDDATLCALSVLLCSLLLNIGVCVRHIIRVVFVRWCSQERGCVFATISRICLCVLVTALVLIFAIHCWPGPSITFSLESRIKLEHLQRPVYSPEDAVHLPNKLFYIHARANSVALRFSGSTEQLGFTVLGRKPYKQVFERYQTEHVALTCHVVFPLNSSRSGQEVALSYYLKWTRNNKDLEPEFMRRGDKYSCEFFTVDQYSRTEIPSEIALERLSPGISWWYIKQTVLITLLDDEDFGTYGCYLRSSYKFKTVSKDADSNMQVLYLPIGYQAYLYTVATFDIRQHQHEVRDVYAVPGSIFRVHTTFWRHKRFGFSASPSPFDDDEQYRNSFYDLFSSVHVRHLVNGKLAEDLEQRECNSLNLVYMYYNYKYESLGQKSEPLGYRFLTSFNYAADDLSECILYKYEMTFCIHSPYYGVHTFVVDTYFSNRTTKELEFISTDYPLTLRVWPSYPDLTGYVDGYGDTTFSECWQDGRAVRLDPCPQRLEMAYYGLFWQDMVERYAMVCAIVINIAVILICAWRIFVATETFLKEGSFCPPSVTTLCGSVLEGKSFCVADVHPGIIYDVFLSYHQSDIAVTNTVRDILTSHGLCVFDCQQDVVDGEQEAAAWNDAILKSASVVVVVSQHYVNCPLLNHLQFRCLYDSMLYGDVPENRLVLVKADNSRVLPSLGPLPVVNIKHPRWHRQLHFLCCGDEPQALKSWYRNLRRNTVNVSRDLRDLITTICFYVTRVKNTLAAFYRCVFIKDRGDVCFDQQLSVGVCLGGAAFEDSDTTSNDCRDVFISYSEEFRPDVLKAAKVKLVLQRQGLSVYDPAHEVLPGQEEVTLVNSAAACRGFVIIMSAAYRRDPMTRRLHFPQMLQALKAGRVDPDSVLIIITAAADDTKDDGSTASNDSDDDDVSDDDHENDDGGSDCGGENDGGDDCRGNRDDEANGDDDDDWHRPEWFEAFDMLQWTGNLSEDDHCRRVAMWGNKVRRQITKHKLEETQSTNRELP